MLVVPKMGLVPTWNVHPAGHILAALSVDSVVEHDKLAQVTDCRAAVCTDYDVDISSVIAPTVGNDGRFRVVVVGIELVAQDCIACGNDSRTGPADTKE